MTKREIDQILDSYTNPVLFKMNDDGSFARDNDGNLIRNFEIN